MKASIFPRLLGTVILLGLVSCGDQQSPVVMNKGTQQAADDYLNQLLHPGESESDLTSQFGQPAFRFGTPTDGLCLIFYFPDRSDAEKTAGICGFEAFFVSNRLSEWLPVYVVSPPKRTQDTQDTLERTGQLQANHAPISLHLVSPERRNGTVFIDTPRFPELGYLSVRPDAEVQTGRYSIRTSSKDPSNCVVEIVLSEDDRQSMEALTTGNVGKRVGVVVGSNIVAAPYIISPILSGRFFFEVPKTEAETLFR